MNTIVFMKNLWPKLNGFFLHSTLHFKQRNCVANSGRFVSDFVEIAIFMLLSVELVASVIRPTNPAGYPAW